MICPHSRPLLLVFALCAAAAPASARQPGDGEPKRPREDLEKAAGKGDAESQYQLGVLLQRAANAPPERAAALSWLRKAAGQGHLLAQHQLGLAHSSSRDEERSLPLAVKWLRKAAEQGHAEAWLALGDLYGEGGPGVPQDLDAARKCYQKADEKGKETVWHSLGDLYRFGRNGIAADWPRAYAFYVKAAGRGHRESQYVLGQFYQFGIGTTADMARAVYWYTEAARLGHGSAEKKLGWLYEHGIGVAKDREKALAWYRKAEQHGASCHWHLKRLGDPEALKRYPPDPEDPVAKDVEITLRPDKDDYDLDSLIIIAIHYRNVGKETLSFTECHTGGFQVPFVVKDEKGRRLANPYEEPSGFGDGHSVHSTHVLQPGKTLVIKKTLNQCVHFKSPGSIPEKWCRSGIEELF